MAAKKKRKKASKKRGKKRAKKTRKKARKKTSRKRKKTESGETFADLETKNRLSKLIGGRK